MSARKYHAAITAQENGERGTRDERQDVVKEMKDEGASRVMRSRANDGDDGNLDEQASGPLAELKLLRFAAYWAMSGDAATQTLDFLGVTDIH
ncbi:hypothetical protein B7463_g9451, partial [Scytalidium lignicola]